MMATETEPRAWVGCLACYAAGRLVGEWTVATEAADSAGDAHWAATVHGSIAADEPLSAHEEWWVMDHEGFHGLLTGECSPVEAQTIAEELAAVDNPEAYAAYWAHVGGERDVASFEDAYAGEWDTFEDYADELADDIGLLSEVPESVRAYFALDRWARDLLLGGDFFTVDSGSGVYVFRGL